MTRLTAGILAVGLACIVGYRASAGSGDDYHPPVTQYDTGDHTARVFAFCIGATGVYLLGDTDEIQTWPSDENCGEGGFLTTADREGEE